MKCPRTAAHPSTNDHWAFHLTIKNQPLHGIGELKNEHMKHFLTVLIAACLCMFTHAQTENPKYDKTLADSLGANENGMKQFFLVILKTGPEDKNITDKAIRDSLFRGHFSNMGVMAKAGKLVVAGPLGKNDKTYRGIFILNAQTLEEARELTLTDPSVKAGIFDVELYPWYGSAALPMYLNYTDKVSKKTPE